jgi:hypothetical protein
MSDTVIKVEGLGKVYRIGSRQNDYRTLRDTITDASPFFVESSKFQTLMSARRFRFHLT